MFRTYIFIIKEKVILPAKWTFYTYLSFGTSSLYKWASKEARENYIASSSHPSGHSLINTLKICIRLQ